MKTEIEVKFINVDKDDVRSRLQAAGATLHQPMRLMRRQVFHLVDRTKDAYVRVRDEGDRVTVTYKQFDSISLHGAKEIETVVDDFESTKNIFIQIGLEPKSYQETRRETWMIDGVEVVIDEWPWLEPFVEIEGPSEELVKSVAAKLSFNWEESVFGAATEAYRRQYHLPDDFIMDELPEIRFKMPVPKILGKTRS
jgi:adenylate cyclase class 2